MADITWPAGIVPNESSMTLIENTAAYENPLTGTVQTLERPGARWSQTLSFRFKTEDERARLQAYLASLRGQANRAVLPVFGHTNRGDGGGTPLVNGAGQTGGTLITDGWPISTVVLRVGDFFSVNGELKMVTGNSTGLGGDPTSGVIGGCQIKFSPILRSSPPDNAPITLVTPTTKYILASPQVGWSNTPWRSGPASDFQLEFIEVFA